MGDVNRLNEPIGTFKIDGTSIGQGFEPYCVAEVGINHNGDFDLAKKMIVVAKESGADAVKFQTFTAEEFCIDDSLQFSYSSQGKEVTESMLKMFSRYEFKQHQWAALKRYADEVGITFLSTPQNKKDLDLLLEIGMTTIKIGSDDLTNIPLIRSFAESKHPLILSCGMSDSDEVKIALETAGWFQGGEVVMLVCTSEYPTPIGSANIRRLETLKKLFPGLLLGFSDHTQGFFAATCAVALGACIFEKHFTLDHEFAGPDHWFSSNPSELKSWINAIKQAALALGNPKIEPTRGELAMRNLARRSVFAISDIARGEIFSEKNIDVRRPGGGLPPIYLDEILGRSATKEIKRGTPIGVNDFV